MTEAIQAKDGSTVNITHVHKLDWMATSLLLVLIVIVALAGYQFGKAAYADTDKSRAFATMQNHVRDLEAEMKTVQNYDLVHDLLIVGRKP